MIWLLAVIAFIVIFSVLILIHELGHFAVARKCGVKVLEFGFGMPPRLWGYQPKKSETIYSINAIPFGGFVRLYGEDSHDAKLLKNKRSFAAQSAWKKSAIVVAGVLMNFILAFVLLTIGLTWGMQPLLVSPEDVYAGINNGVVQLGEGIVVKENGPNDIGFQKGDQIIMVNDRHVVMGDELDSLKDKQEVVFRVRRGAEVLDLKGVNDVNKPFFVTYDPMEVPKLVVKSVAAGSPYGLKAGDTIDKINGKMIFSLDDLERELKANDQPQIDVTSAGRDFVPPAVNTAGNAADIPIVISGVVSGSPAEQAGLKPGDQVISINDVKVNGVEDLPKAVKTEVLKDKMVYKIQRGDSEVEYFIRKGEGGLVGVLLSGTVKLADGSASFYVKYEPYSIIKIADVSYPFWEAPGRALQEMWRLSVLTVEMFGNVVASVFTRLAVPEGVAGPVGIAQMTFVFVQEGVMSLLRFTALLSLSLAIINILPFPGLDGGRLALILLPVIIRRKINPRLEAMIHVFGFIFLMLLIFLVTFNDIMHLFVK